MFIEHFSWNVDDGWTDGRMDGIMTLLSIIVIKAIVPYERARIDAEI